jgi:Lamin Tail Domain
MKPAAWYRRIGQLIGFAALCSPGIARGQVVITEVMHSPGGADHLWEWVEIVNAGAQPVDLDGWVFDDDDDSSFAAANISSAEGTRNTLVPAGGVAVLYPGDELEFMPQRFNAAWGGGVSLIAVDGFTALTATDAIGLWSNHENYLADAIPMATNSPRRTFSTAAAALDYSTGFPAPAGGHSIAWSGNGGVSSGSNWAESQSGNLGAFASAETSIAETQINSSNDRGNPGLLPAGPIAPGLRITEIMFAPESPLVSAVYTESDFEWIEIYNNSPVAIDFAADAYVLDDTAGGKLAAANIDSGTLAVGEIGILFNPMRLTADDMRAMWGESYNYIPVSQWPSLNNGPETIAIWENMGDYNTEPVTGTGRTHDNAIAAASYQTTAMAGWPTINDQSSIWIHDLSGDPNDGANWTRAGATGDTLSRQAEPIYQTAIDHEGGDVGSPGYVPGVPPAGLEADFNNDGRVDAADYVVWRSSSGSPAEYATWSANFGSSLSGGAASEIATIPEPPSAISAFCVAVYAFLSRVACDARAQSASRAA